MMHYNEELYNALIENAGDAFFIHDDEGRIIQVNQLACTSLGYSREELLKLMVTDVEVGLDVNGVKKDWSNITKGNSLTLLGTHKRKDGSIFPVEGRITVTELNGQKLFLALVRDISERKRAEEQLKASEAKYRYLFENNPLPMWIYDLETLAFLEVNEAAIAQYGYSREEFLSMTIKDIRPAEEVAALLEDVKNTSDPLNKAGLWKHLKKNGDLIYVEIESHLLEYGDCQARLVLANNVTEKTITDQRNVILNRRLTLLIDIIKDLSTAPNLEAVMEIVRSNVRKLTNADGSTFILKEGEFCHYADEDAILPLWKGQRFPLDKCISGWTIKNKKEALIVDIYKDPRIPIDSYRETFVKSLLMVPIREADPLGAIGSYWAHHHIPAEMEINLIKTLADAAARAVENIQLVESLERKVEQRTQQLQEINRELGAFTYSVSHDLKAPLRGIDGYGKLLHDLYKNDLPDEAREFINNIRSSTLKMNQLIDDLLEYSRLERSEVRSESIKMRDLIYVVQSLHKEELKRGNFELADETGGQVITADLKGLTIALRNLVSNAIKFSMGREFPKINIALDNNPDSWVLSVRDNGIGFEMKYHERIFEIFQRLHRPEEYPGTGIGLAMVHKAMTRMNGRTWAESIPGKGSVFYLEIPKTQ